MTVGPAAELETTPAGAPPRLRLRGRRRHPRLGEGSLIAEGAVIRSERGRVEIGTGTAVLENSVVVGNSRISTSVGRRSVFGHRCLVIGTAVGDLCEIGNGSILMPGARVGDRVFSVRARSSRRGHDSQRSVAVGRPAAAWSRAPAERDLIRLLGFRGGDLSLPGPTAITVESRQETILMGQLYEYRGILPIVAASAAVFSQRRDHRGRRRR